MTNSDVLEFQTRDNSIVREVLKDLVEDSKSITDIVCVVFYNNGYTQVISSGLDPRDYALATKLLEQDCMETLVENQEE